VSTDLARTGPVGVAMSNPADALRACELLLSSGVLPADIRTAEAAFAIIQTGAEMGLAPMQALRSIHVVKGRPILSADLMVAMCLRSGVCKYFRRVADDGQRAEYETLREGMPEPARMAYTLAEAEVAGLTRNPTWRAHTRAMIRARAKSALARDVYPDLVAGIYTPDEGREIAGEYHVPQPSRPVSQRPAVDAEVVDVQADPSQAPTVDTSEAELAMQAHGMTSPEMALAWLTSQRPPLAAPAGPLPLARDTGGRGRAGRVARDPCRSDVGAGVARRRGHPAGDGRARLPAVGRGARPGRAGRGRAQARHRRAAGPQRRPHRLALVGVVAGQGARGVRPRAGGGEVSADVIVGREGAYYVRDGRLVPREGAE